MLTARELDELRSDDSARSRVRYGHIQQQTSRWSFEAGLPDPTTFPIDDLARLSERVLRDDGTDGLQYGSREDSAIVYGYEGLRDLLAERANEKDGRDDLGRAGVMLTHGGVQGITLASDAFLNPGDGFAAEVAAWQTVLVAARKTGAILSPIPIDDDGMIVDALEEELRRVRDEGRQMKLVYSCATFHSPTGVCMSVDRRRRLLELADEWNFVILEDNVYGELRYDGETLPSLLSLDRSGRVMKVDAFTKILAPALRLGWVSGNPALLEVLSSVRGDLGVSQWTARVMAEFMREGLLEPHIERVKELYRRKRDIVVDALERYCAPWVTWRVPDGGYFIWVELSDRVDWRQVRIEAYRRGVECRPGERFFDDERSGERFLRIAFTMVPIDELEPGIEVLGEAIQQSITE